jgi:CTP:phosphocholine cytidylyltransferase-like protein/thiamine kinase-like enzyme
MGLTIQKNAIILAAGKSNRFAPFTYEKPKGLFRVKGDILIERQIEQLRTAGVKDIYIVVGYMKEKFFYLEKKYGVHLLVNNTFGIKGNIYSLYTAREYLENTFICCADHYFVYNPFTDSNVQNCSYRACSYHEGSFREFAVEYSDASVITDVAVGGRDHMTMVGHAYFNKTFSELFRKYMEAEINDFGVAGMFWEEFYAKHQKNLTLYMKEYDEKDILEFDSIDDLRQFDSEFLFNVDSEIITNICRTIDCHPNNIVDIAVIQAGLTNVSFVFTAGGIKYVYRHPGGTAGNLINRKAERYAQYKAKELGVDKSVIYMDESGWKISYYVPDMVSCDFETHPEQFKLGMEYLRKIHGVQVDSDIKVFDDVKEGKKLMTIASASKGNLFSEFSELIEKIEKLDLLVKADAVTLGIKPVLCHNDAYVPNYLATQTGELYLIDWEYAGINDPANDVACILCRGDYSKERTEEYLREYFGRELTPGEHRHYIAYIALCGFYWFCWGLYKGSVGDDDGFFFLPAYRSCIRYIDIALESYAEGNQLDMGGDTK